MTNKKYHEYKKKKLTEAIMFGKDIDLRKDMVEKAMKERCNEIIQNIVLKNDIEIAKDDIKYQEELNLIKLMDKASSEGIFELVQELLNNL